MQTTTLTLTRDEVKALKAAHRAVSRKLDSGAAPDASDMATLELYARATCQSWATYTGEPYYLTKVGPNLFPATRFDLEFRAADGLPAREIVEVYRPMTGPGSWYATSLGTV